jgi:DNA-binding NarL/FixJ family response regulator
MYDPFQSRNHRIRTMVVDASPDQSSALRSSLAGEQDFDTVGVASTGGEALQQVRSLRPDLILLDLQMPDMNALEAAMHLRRRSPSTRVVILTDQDPPGANLRRACEYSGITGLVTRTQPPQNLVSEIRQLLAARS